MGRRKQPSDGLTKGGKISRSWKKTPETKYQGGKRTCPTCGADAGQNLDYDYDEETKEITFFYRCKECGQTFRCIRTMEDLCRM